MDSDADFLRNFLAGRDVPCPMCEYNLRDLVGERCPECGDRIELRVNSVEPKQGAVITGLTILACGFGFNCLFLLWIMSLTLRRGGRGGIPVHIFYISLAGFIVEGIATGIWLVQWKKIRRMHTAQRWSLAVVLCGLLTLIDLIVFVIFVQ